MRSIFVGGVCVVLAWAPACLAQQHDWELGGAAGFGIIRNVTISNPSGSLSAGLDNRFAASGVFGQDLYQHAAAKSGTSFAMVICSLKAGGKR